MKKNNKVRNLAISAVVVSLLATTSIGLLSKNSKHTYMKKYNTQAETNYDDLKITEAIHYKDGKIVFLTNMNEIENDPNYVPYVEENIDLIDHVEVYGEEDERSILTPEEYKTSKSEENNEVKKLKK